MRFRRIGLVAVIGLAVAVPAVGPGSAQAAGNHHGHDAIVIAHRGASGYRPEHTLGAYKLAIEQGADYIEPDVVSTKDGVLVARHENEISGTTDVAAHPEFTGRRTTKTIDGVAVTGWFTEDFTLAELKTLRAKERLPDLRPANTAYDGRYEIPTLQEVIDLVKRESRRHHRQIGIAPETKHPTYFASIGLPLEKPLVRVLRRNGLDHRHAKVVIQSFEVGNLIALNKQTKVELAQLVNASGKPYDFVANGDPRTYDDLITPAGLKAMRTYADWVAPEKSRIIPRDASGALTQPTALVRNAHRAGLRVVTWTFRAENTFLPADFRNGTDPATHGDLVGEIQTFLATGLDAFFTDFPDLGVQAVEED